MLREIGNYSWISVRRKKIWCKVSIFPHFRSNQTEKIVELKSTKRSDLWGWEELTEKSRIENARTPIRRRMKKERTFPKAYLKAVPFEVSEAAIDCQIELWVKCERKRESEVGFAGRVGLDRRRREQRKTLNCSCGGFNFESITKLPLCCKLQWWVSVKWQICYFLLWRGGLLLVFLRQGSPLVMNTVACHCGVILLEGLLWYSWYSGVLKSLYKRLESV